MADTDTQQTLAATQPLTAPPPPEPLTTRASVRSVHTRSVVASVSGWQQPGVQFAHHLRQAHNVGRDSIVVRICASAAPTRTGNKHSLLLLAQRRLQGYHRHTFPTTLTKLSTVWQQARPPLRPTHRQLVTWTGGFALVLGAEGEPTRVTPEWQHLLPTKRIDVDAGPGSHTKLFDYP